jgi:predicted  nucleic acid-binding Zn-ribbon protein
VTTSRKLFIERPLPFELGSLRREPGTGTDRDVWYFAGVYQRADQRNANGRIYPRKLWEHLLGSPVFLEKLKRRQLVGSLGHPTDPDGVLSPKEISHVTVHLEVRPNGEVYGESEILPTPSGQILLTLLQSGVGLGVSSRGWGESWIDGDTEILVEDSFELQGFDIVVDPSVEGAYPQLVRGSAVRKVASLVGERLQAVKSSDPQTRRACREELEAWRRVLVPLARCEGLDCILESIDRTLQEAGDMSELSALTAKVSELESAIASLGKAKDAEIAALKRAVKAIEADRDALRHKLAGSEEMIDRLGARLKAAEDKAKKATDALREALRQGRAKAQELRASRAKLDAARRLVASSLKEVRAERERQWRRHIFRLAAEFRDPKRVRHLLMTHTRTVEEATALARELRALERGGRYLDAVREIGSRRSPRLPEPTVRLPAARLPAADPGERALLQEALVITQNVIKKQAS